MQLQKWRRLLINAPRATPVNLTGRHIVVTGAAPGSLGFEAARQFASWGAHVVVTTRSNVGAVVTALRATLDPSQHANIEGHLLDLCEQDSVRDFAAWYRGKFNNKLDVLVNNAGIHLDLLSQWKQPTLTADGFELHWRTNYLGTAHLTQLLLPALTATAASSGDARIVNVVSQLHKMGANADLLGDAPFAEKRPYNSWHAYGNSKLALVHFTFELQRRLSGQQVQAYCLHPGGVYTNIAGKGLAGNPLLEGLRNVFAPVERFFLNTVEEGAQTILYCATGKSLAGGRYFERCAESLPCADATDAGVSKRLWDETQAWIAS